MKFPIAAVLLCALAFAASPLFADNPLPSIVATLAELNVPYASVTPELTASDADPAWRTAAVVPKLTRAVGDDASGANYSPESDVSTRVSLLWNERCLYVRFDCDGFLIPYVPYRGRDGDLWRDDVAEVFLDVRGDSKSYIEIEVSPLNDILDKLYTVDGMPHFTASRMLDADTLAHRWHENLAWNLTGIRTAATLTPHGWRVDMALPAAGLADQLGSAQYRPGPVRANLLRYQWVPDAKGVYSLIGINWSPTIFGCPHLSPDAMGTLNLISK